MKKVIVVLAVIAVLAFPAGATAAHPVVMDVVHHADAFPRTTRCYPASTLHRMVGGVSPGTYLMGIAQQSTNRMWLNNRLVCKPLLSFQQGGPLTERTLDAFVTVGHEAAHLRGVHNESRATCAGVKFTWSYLRWTGDLDYFGRDWIRRHLLSNRGRSAGYELGHCLIV